MPQDVKRHFSFEAAHFLTLVPDDHKCRRMHGHSYRVKIHARGFVDRRTGMVVDYAEIDAAVDPIIASLDHRTLNDILPYETTAENLAFWIGQQLCAYSWLHAVEIFETVDSEVFLKIR